MLAEPSILIRRVVLGFSCALGIACVPEGGGASSDAATTTKPAAKSSAPASTFRPSTNVMREVFEDDFEKPATLPRPLTSGTAPTASVNPAPSASAGQVAAPKTSASPTASAAESPRAARTEIGPDWTPAAGATAWKLENGKLCGQGAKNKGIWLNRTLPINARIEFDATSDSPDGDLKAEVWGDGRSAATSVSYNNATSYLVIFGGWQNSLHVLARLNEHGKDRLEQPLEPGTTDVRKAPVVRGKTYRFKVQRTDGKTLKWFVDDAEIHSFADPKPLIGTGHDRFGFNNWEAKVCFDNVRVTPL